MEKTQSTFYQQRRDSVLENMEPGSMAVLYSGIELHISADEYAPFLANRNFYYLTGLRRDQMALILDKSVEPAQISLFIEEADPLTERWNGRKVTMEEAAQISGIADVRFITDLDEVLDYKITRQDVKSAYFDTYRHSKKDLPDYNLQCALDFAKAYPGIPVKNLFPLVASLRMWKDEAEVTATKEAIRITKDALQNVMRNLKPGMKEYQAQADFEYVLQREGSECPAFPTIAGSGMNGTMLHYDTNRDTCEDGQLLLLDLGARIEGYNSDITRTYPVNGHFSDRQRQVYDLVLSANRAVAAAAGPGMTLKELNDVCKRTLADGLIKLGLIEDPSEVSKYYMHSVSHHLGLDVHDVTVAVNEGLQPGAIITDEPGLYIDEWEIGIRIEDDLLITEDGAIVLSEDIIRTAEEIEAFMNR